MVHSGSATNVSAKQLSEKMTDSHTTRTGDYVVTYLLLTLVCALHVFRGCFCSLRLWRAF